MSMDKARTNGINTSKQQILLLDDDPVSNFIHKKMLQKIGYSEIIECKNGLKALTLIESLQSAVIILDLNMPEIDGIRFIRELSSRNFQGGLILVSGESESILQTCSTLASSHKIKVLGYSQKPISEQLLKTLLDNWIVNENTSTC